jgi:hypothetical protein
VIREGAWLDDLRAEKSIFHFEVQLDEKPRPLAHHTPVLPATALKKTASSQLNAFLFISEVGGAGYCRFSNGSEKKFGTDGSRDRCRVAQLSGDANARHCSELLSQRCQNN